MRVTELDGSSNPALCTSHTGVGDAPCSGPTRPAHRVSLEVAMETHRPLA